ncbi:DUF2971 domain-containing protein [Pseudomonas frederiksbergensis]|uniref:DUF2971 domain-containing protein n=1 Tax=Pseudomonas frederiksbergensis TaxID=104087 RepID=UPI003D1D98F3
MAGRYLYKYVEFDKELNVLKLITESKIKFSEPAKFNDPFDCNPYYIGSNDPKKLRPDLFARLDSYGKSPAERLIATQQAINRANASFKDGRFQEATMAAVGILSLSRTPWHVLMWSHYAKHHTGFVVEFQEPDVIPPRQNGLHQRWLVTFEVEYTVDRPVVERWKRTELTSIDKIFMSKSIEWAYEEEERVVNYIGGPGIFEYESSLLKSVIAGCKISDKHFALLSAAVKDANKHRKNKISLFRAELDERKYQLNIPKFNRPRSPAIA